MLFGYPINATAENWLHDCLLVIIEVIHTSHDAGQAVPTWSSIIPVTYRTSLENKRGLRDRFDTYSNSVKRLSVKKRKQVLNCFYQQNKINDLLTCVTDCEYLTDLPKTVRSAIINLFEFAFELLKNLGIRDRQYQIILSKIPYKMCPFCGCEFFNSLDGAREDLDHYLPKSIYPFAAANLHNLVPMGKRCNEQYKRNQDILKDSSGNRRKSFIPYEDRSIKIHLYNSVPFNGLKGIIPEWQIEFDPDSVECTTWDAIFDFKERIKSDVLNLSFEGWLVNFSDWFKSRRAINNPTNTDVLDAIAYYIDDLKNLGLSAKDFLRIPVFQMLHKQCQDGNHRVLDLVKNTIKMATP